MIIRCYNFKKRHNDTLRPIAEVSVQFTVYVKRNTSVNNPIFLLDIGNSEFSYNYIYVVDWDMYYWVDDIVYGNNNIKEVVCSIDPLATARDEIVAAMAFVKYSSLNYDPYIKDDRVQPTSEIETLVSTVNYDGLISTPENSSTYCYVITTVNDEGVCSYLINYTTLKYLGDEIINHADDITGVLKQFFTDAHSAIVKLQVIPWSRTALSGAGVIGSNTIPIKLGGYTTGQEGYLINASATFIDEDSVDVPTLPNNFTRIEPYCDAKIHLPLMGVHDLSLSEIADVNSVHYRYISNVLTGATACILYKGSNINNGKIIASLSGNVNFDIPLGYISSQNPTGIISGGVGAGTAIAGIIAGASSAVVVGGIGAAVASFASYLTKTASSIGSFGGNASAYDCNRVSIVVYKHGLTENPTDLIGRYGGPCGKVLPLSSLVGGYVQTSQFELISGFDAELVSEVNRLLDSGIYLS